MQFKRYSLFALLLAALLFVPQAIAQNSLTVSPPVSTGPDHEQNQRIGGDVVITHSKFDDVVGGGVACAGPTGAPVYTTQNSYWRLFDLADMGIMDAVTLTSVDLGVGRARLNGNDPVTTTLRFYTLEGDFLIENLTVIGEEEVILEDKDNPFLLGVPITSTITVPEGAMFVVEWDAPSGDPEDTGNIKPFDIRFGQNGDGQTGPTYLSAEACGIAEPTDAAAIGFPDLHWVLYVNGTTDPVSNEEGAVAQRVTLGQAYPNPVVGQASIPFSLENAQHVRIAVYDALGREVAVAADAAFGAGEQLVAVNASGLPNGVYFYRISTESQTLTRKMVVMQ